MENFNLYFTIFLLFLSTITFSLFSLFRRHHSHFSSARCLPPGAVGLPLIGESLQFLSAGRQGHPEKFIFDRVIKFSSHVFKTHILGVPVAVLCGVPGNKFLFSNEDKLVTAWWPESVDKIFPSSTQTSSKEEAKKMRKLLPQFLKPEALQKYIGVMDAMAKRHFESEWECKDQVLVFPLAKRYTFLLACRIFMSIEDASRIAEFEASFNLLAAGIISVPIDFPGTPFNRAIRAARFIRKELLRIIRRRRADLENGNAIRTQDVLSHMLTAACGVSEANAGLMKDEDVADKILGLLIGGHDTASAACTFIVKYLAEIPGVYEGVYKEQMEIAKSKEAGELLSWEDIQKMKYSWNVACEVMRLAPPLQGAFREALNDFVFNGFYIPKGWKLYWSAISTHKDPKHFPDPEKFDPSRFERSGPAPFTYVPFGGGPRMCPGKEYARLEILVFIHNLVKQFKWEKVLPDEKIVVDPLPMPAKGLPVRLFPHKS